MTDEEFRAAIELEREKRGESHAKVNDLRKRLYNLTPEEMGKALELLGKTEAPAAMRTDRDRVHHAEAGEFD